MTRFRVPTEVRGVLTFVVFACALTACNGKPCSDPPKYDEYDEEVVEKLDDMLDDADAYDSQRTRVLAINTKLGKDREVFRVGYEAVRAKMIDQLVAVAPQVQVFHTLLDDMQKVFMTYVYRVIDDSLVAHRWFTATQRKAMTEDWEEPPDEYTIPWSTNRAIDLAMLEISATDEQKALVKAAKEKMEKKTDKLLKDQHAVRMKLIAQWHQRKVDPPTVRKHIDEGAAQISTFMHSFTDAAFQVTSTLTPQQRLWTNKQINRLRRCQE